MMVAVETVEVPTGDIHPARADVYRPPDPATRPTAGSRAVVLLVHGFKGYKTWGFLPYLATRLAAANMTAVALDLSHNGTFPAPPGSDTNDTAAVGPSSGAATVPLEPSPYVRPDLFERNTLTREVTDVAAAVDWLAEGTVTAGREPAIGLFAHSRGGVAAVVNAVEKRAVRCLCTWSAAADPDHFTPAQKARWRSNGYFEFALARGGQKLRMGLGYLDDIEKNATRYRPAARAAELRIPHLIVHGRLDLAVKPADSWALFDAETRVPDRRCLLIRAGHTFGVDERAPLRGEAPKALLQAADATVRWFESHLSKWIRWR